MRFSFLFAGVWNPPAPFSLFFSPQLTPITPYPSLSAVFERTSFRRKGFLRLGFRKLVRPLPAAIASPIISSTFFVSPFFPRDLHIRLLCSLSQEKPWAYCLPSPNSPEPVVHSFFPFLRSGVAPQVSSAPPGVVQTPPQYFLSPSHPSPSPPSVSSFSIVEFLSLLGAGTHRPPPANDGVQLPPLASTSPHSFQR